MLNAIPDKSVFLPAIPELPMGRYAHFVILRRTDSYALFQTDGELNLARVSAGLAPENQDLMTRVVLFKRKQSTPERLTGREMLRAHGIIAANEEDEKVGRGKRCEYNSSDFCKVCPDCILYGFAIGNQGSERSKVLVDSAFSLTAYDESHQQMTFNAPYETGTMGKAGVMKTAIGEQDHVSPQVFFPSVVTLKDPTEAGFAYVLGNILRTHRYGAQTTRTGTVDNQVLAVTFADGEIFSNLKLTQNVTDLLREQSAFQSPLPAAAVQAAVSQAVPSLLAQDGVQARLCQGEPLQALLAETLALLSDPSAQAELVRTLATEALTYAQKFGVLAKAKN